MTQEEIYSNLCIRDPRNPEFDTIYYDEDDEKPIPREKCSCDNCFYGRDVLAIEILSLLTNKNV